MKDEDGNDAFQEIFPKDRPVPCKEKIILTNSYDFQTIIPIILYENGIEIIRFEMRNLRDFVKSRCFVPKIANPGVKRS